MCNRQQFWSGESSTVASNPCEQAISKDLPRTSAGNKHVVVFLDFLTKFPLVFPNTRPEGHPHCSVTGGKVVPLFGVPEAVEESHLMKGVCAMLGTLNTTAYHPECDGMVERFNRTLKTTSRKYAAKSGH